MDKEESVPVDLHIYDLTHGMASILSPAILGRQIEGVWHTAVVVYGREYFFGGNGITSCSPGSTQLGAPLQVDRIGTTSIPFNVFLDYIQGLATSTYTPDSYRLLEHNCNNFSEEICQFLCGGHIPKHILDLPNTALPPQLRAAITALLDNMVPGNTQAVYAGGVRHARQASPDFLTLNNQIEEARQQSLALEQRRSTLVEKLAKKERKKEKKRKKQQKLGFVVDGEGDHDPDMAEAVDTRHAEEIPRPSASNAVDLDEDEDRKRDADRNKNREPPIIFGDIDAAQEFEKLTAAINDNKVELTPDEEQSIEELRQYLVLGEGSWVLGDNFLSTIGRLVSPQSPPPARSGTLCCLSAAALREDVSLLLHQDRRDHTLVNYAHDIDTLTRDEQKGVATFMCNLFANVSSSEWLLYISEWEKNGQPISNIRVSTKVTVHALLSEDEDIRDIGTALLHNIATKEVKTVVFDDVCVELAMAVLQFLGNAPKEEHLYRSLKSLARLVVHSHDVPQLVQMIGPDPAAFRGTSQRIDEQIDLIMRKLK